MLTVRGADSHSDEERAIVAIQSTADNGADVLRLNFLCELRDIPDAVKSLREQLEVLRLDNNYSLRVLPALLGDFPRLRSLDARYCGLEEMNPAVCRLTRLTELYLSNNAFRFLPTELSQLKALQTLRVDNNKLRVLPGGLVFLSKLQEITVENNPLYTPEEIAGAAAVTLVPPLPSVDCANCCARVRNYEAVVSFHRIPSHKAALLPFVFFLCSGQCRAHLAQRLERHDERMRA